MPDQRPEAQSLGLPGRRFEDMPGLPGEDLLRGSGGEPAPGPGSDEGNDSILARAASLRFPDLKALTGRERVDRLIDHITDTAILRGELEELRLGAHVTMRDAAAELVAVPTGVTKNRAAIDEGKRLARPDLAVKLDGAQWLVQRCTEQINRLGGSDYDAASRCYTLITG